MTKRSVFPVWLNSQFIHCSCKRQRCEPNGRTKYENVIAYVIKNLIFRKIHLFQTALKNLPNKYFSFGQLLLSSVVNIGELLYKQAVLYSITKTRLFKYILKILQPKRGKFSNKKF